MTAGHPDPFGTADITAAGAAPDAEAALWPTVLLGWTIAAIAVLAIGAVSIATLRFPDPDDTMRLLQVRDWLAGQSWWDVTQYRLGPAGLPMHWSRLVDLPLAAAMALFDPLLGQAASTRVAMTIVPLLTLGAIMALAAAITRQVAGVAVARLAVLVTPLSVPILYQARPLRIDHHGWQIVLALAAVVLLLGRATPRRGALAGLALAALLTISLEGVPIAAAIAGVAALAWAIEPARRGFLLSLAGTLAAAAAMLHALTRWPAMAAMPCDAMSPAWLAVLATAAAALVPATMVRAGPVARLAALGGAGAAAGVVWLAVTPAICMAGPFASLPPSVYRLWYLNVLEGRPLWEQTPFWAAITIGLPLAGLVGAVAGWRRTQGEARRRWGMLLLLLVAATALSLLVNRAGATANALAVPGAAALLLAMLTRARAVPHTGRRTLATLGALLLASPGQAAAIALTAANALSPPEERAAAERGWHRASCDRFDDLRALRALPAGLVFAPIDPSPEIIATTRHRAVAAGYHRGGAAMAQVIEGFTAAPQRARAIILASGANYVAICPGLNEVDLYRLQSPQGLWARLERGERMAWLVPAPLSGTPALAWRVVRSANGKPTKNDQTRLSVR